MSRVQMRFGTPVSMAPRPSLLAKGFIVLRVLQIMVSLVVAGLTIATAATRLPTDTVWTVRGISWFNVWPAFFPPSTAPKLSNPRGGTY